MDTDDLTPEQRAALDTAWADYAKRLGAAAVDRAALAPDALPPGYGMVTVFVPLCTLAEAPPDSETQRWIRPGDPLAAGTRTPEVMTQMRAEAVVREQREGAPPVQFTCDSCGFAARCPLVYDGYNTQGDCLWMK